MVSLVGAGMGVALVAASVTRFQPPNVVFRPLKDPSKLLFIEMGLSRRASEDSPAADAFLETARTVAPG